MTFDIVALCRERPDAALTLAAMREAGAALRVDTVQHAQLVQLYHPDGRLLLTIEGARLVQVAGEVQRLLGVAEGVPHPGGCRGRSGDLEVQIATLPPAGWSLELGASTQSAVRALTGGAPAGWGVAEPVPQPWSPREVTAHCRERAPSSSRLVVIAPGMVGQLHVEQSTPVCWGASGSPGRSQAR